MASEKIWAKCIRFALGAVMLSVAVTIVRAENSAELQKVFANPPREYSSGPLWVWNDMLTEEQVRATLRDLAAQHVKQAWVHPRPGLMTPYLSEEWFKLWKVALDEAKRLDMNIWIYDENSYPSGFAGGFVPEAMPESRGQGIVFNESKVPSAWTNDTTAVFRIDANKSEDVSDAVRAGKTLPEGRYLTASIQYAKSSPWFGNKWYVDLLHPGVTQKFLSITLDAYKRELGDEFGKHVPGSFTDEPHLAPADGLHWTPDLPQVFQQRRGYALIPNLASLVQPVGDWKRVRHDYFQTLLELFIERWAKPYGDYCAANGLEFTGHYWEHEWPHSVVDPDNMAMYAWHQRPAIDCLFNQYAEGVHAQFGNVRAGMELGSVANQIGQRRTLCEAYGGGGWDLRFEDMKRIGDWLYVLGINTLNQHLSDITIRGARKADYPQTFSYHEPWWNEYHSLADYFARLSAALSHGEQLNSVLVIEPTTTAWMYQTGEDKAHMEEIGTSFQQLVTNLAKAQVEFDLGSEDIIARHGSVKDKSLVVGRRAYDAVVIPPFTENLNAKTAELLDAYVKAGGNLIACGTPSLSMVNGEASDRGQAIMKGASCKQTDPAGLTAMLLANRKDGFAVTPRAGDGILYHHRRRFSDGDLVFLVNTSITASTEGEISTRATSVQQWNLETGAIAPHLFARDGDVTKVAFNLAPCGSLLLFLSTTAGGPGNAVATTGTAIAAKGPMSINRIEPNLLTLDYVDITIGGDTKKNLYFYDAGKLAFASVGLNENPWDSAVQFRDELITKKLPPNAGFEVSYRFTVEGAVPKGLQAVVERPDLYTITCNGTPVSAQAGSWWLDRAFGKIEIAAAAKAGENVITLKTGSMTLLHEIEPIYILGLFSLKSVDRGFVIAPDAALNLGPWNTQGHQLYAAGVSYTQTFDVAKTEGRYIVRLTEWYGSVAKVNVNGEAAGQIAWKPWECDVTSHIKPGSNTIEVVVIGTLKNTLGPHHNNPPLGIASPGSFRKGPNPGPPPGTEYSTVGYGLMKAFELEHR